MYANDSVYYCPDIHSLIPTEKRDFQTSWCIWPNEIFRLTLYYLGGNLSSLPGAERGFSIVIMAFCHFSQVVFPSAAVWTLKTVQSFLAWGCFRHGLTQRIPGWSLPPTPTTVVPRLEVTIHENGSPILMSVIFSERGEEREEKGSGKQMGELMGQMMGDSGRKTEGTVS